LIFGQFPAIRAKTVNFISDKVPGIKVPKSIIDDMNLAAMDGKEKEEKIGFELSVKVLKDIVSIHPKVHLMTHNRFKLCSNLIDNIV